MRLSVLVASSFGLLSLVGCASTKPPPNSSSNVRELRVPVLMDIDEARKATPAELDGVLFTISQTQLDLAIADSVPTEDDPPPGTPSLLVFKLPEVLFPDPKGFEPRFGIVPYCFPRHGEPCVPFVTVEHDGEIWVRECKCDGPQTPIRFDCSVKIAPFGCGAGNCAEPQTKCRLTLKRDRFLNFVFSCQCAFR